MSAITTAKIKTHLLHLWVKKKATHISSPMPRPPCPLASVPAAAKVWAASTMLCEHARSICARSLQFTWVHALLRSSRRVSATVGTGNANGGSDSQRFKY